MFDPLATMIAIALFGLAVGLWIRRQWTRDAGEVGWWSRSGGSGPAWVGGDERAARGLRCCQCRYDLRGLHVDGVCPECGTPVAESIHENCRPYSTTNRGQLIDFGIVVAMFAIFVAVSAAVASVNQRPICGNCWSGSSPPAAPVSSSFIQMCYILEPPYFSPMSSDGDFYAPVNMPLTLMIGVTLLLVLFAKPLLARVPMRDRVNVFAMMPRDPDERE